MHRYVFAILHYQAIDMTIECIDSIEKLNDNKNDIKIIVVDNGSPNRSGIMLKEKYSYNDNITVLLEKKNLGFAQGNNIAYKYAKNVYSPDAIIIINNDIVFKDDTFIYKLDGIIEKEDNISIIAPDIINKKNEHQNPVKLKKTRYTEIAWVLIYNLFLLIILRVPYINDIILNVIEKHKSKRPTQVKQCMTDLINIMPHGAAIVFTSNFIKNENYAFCPKTFLYGEEDILFDYTIKKGYITKYYRDLHVWHVEDISTKTVSSDVIRRRLFISKHKVHSMIVLLAQRFGR